MSWVAGGDAAENRSFQAHVQRVPAYLWVAEEWCLGFNGWFDNKAMYSKHLKTSHIYIYIYYTFININVILHVQYCICI